MKQFRFLVFTLIFTGLSCFSIQAQSYDSAVGARLGSPLSASYKKFINDSDAVELFASFRSVKWATWIGVGGAYQIHNDISEVNGLQWYYGAGASLYLYSYKDDFLGIENEGTVAVGLQGYLGLDYAFSDTPVNLSLDWVPTLLIGGYGSGFGASYGALAVRYILD